MNQDHNASPKIAIYPGSFDPITNGHIDIVERASALFDRVIVALAANSAKTLLFDQEERRVMISDAVAHLPNVSVAETTGLMIEYAAQSKAIALIRGLRAISDFEYEFQMALMNRKLAPNIITVFLMPHDKYTYLNSSIIREVASFGGDVSQFVPPGVVQRLKTKFSDRR